MHLKQLLTFLCLSFALFAGDRGWISVELADMYRCHSEPQYKWAHTFFDSFSFDDSINLLDFGCGDGKITAELANKFQSGHVVGVDCSPCMIEVAKREFPHHLHQNLTFITTPAETLGLYDVITAFSVFHFVDKPVELLKNLRSHLKNNGKLFLLIPLPPNTIMRNAANDCFPKYGLSPPWHLPNYSSHLSMRTTAGAMQKLEEADFQILSFNEVASPMIFPNKEDFVLWLMGTASANWGIPLEIAQPFFNELVDKMLELDPTLSSSDGSVHYPQALLQIIAGL